MRLVDDWKRCWRWFSIHCLILAGAIPPVWASLPDNLTSHIPAEYMGTVTAVVAVCGVIGRLVDQRERP